MSVSTDLEQLAINTIRFLSADAVQNANSGHPGLPMGGAAMAYTLWMKHLRFNPSNPRWWDRDRFVLSGGHGSMLLYSLLHLTGYDLSLEEIKNFRQWESLTPGHPEYGLTPGVEATTGPLGQGFANGVGMAIAQAHLAAEFNRPGYEIVNHYTYAICTDGDLMEGVASEAASLAGHLQLGKLIYLYDDNHISIDGSTDLAFTEDRGKRFEAYGWHVQHIADGNDVKAIDRAITAAKKDPRPSIIMVHTLIGYGLPTREGTNKAHGEPPGEEELQGAKKKLGWPLEPRFFIPGEALEHFRESVDRGNALESEWRSLFERYCKEYPELGSEFERRMAGILPEAWDADLPVFPADAKGMATRAASGKVINAMAPKMPEMMGGSGDLTPSNNNWIQTSLAFQKDSPEGRNIHFGVREHGMGAIANGIALHGGLITYCATFLTFSDYMRPSIRLAALSHYPTIFIFTHDSIGLGEDGPTHQPVEHFAALRAIPNLLVLRPGDANEVREAWKVLIERRHAPGAIILTRQAVPVLDRSQVASAEGLRKGAYVLADLGTGRPSIILIATGSEVPIIMEAAYALEADGVSVRVVSMPSWELFEQQERAYQESVLPQGIPLRLAVEAGIPMGWSRWVGDRGSIIGVEKFGSSAPYKVLYEKYGLTVQNILNRARQMLGNDEQ